MRPVPLPSVEYFASLLSYEPDTGILLWRRRVETSSRLATWNARFADKPAGTITRDGYIKVRIEGRGYLAHRVAWLLFYCEEPVQDIDHKNRNKADNRIENLRLATKGQNRLNSKISRNNTTGHPNVYFITGNKQKQWRASVKIDGKTICIGHYDTMDEAIVAYRRTVMECQSEFAPIDLWEALRH